MSLCINDAVLCTRPFLWESHKGQLHHDALFVAFNLAQKSSDFPDALLRHVLRDFWSFPQTGNAMEESWFDRQEGIMMNTYQSQEGTAGSIPKKDDGKCFQQLKATWLRVWNQNMITLKEIMNESHNVSYFFFWSMVRLSEQTLQDDKNNATINCNKIVQNHIQQTRNVFILLTDSELCTYHCRLWFYKLLHMSVKL